MSYPTDRVILFDRDMNPLPELSPDEVFSRVRTEEINGEHSLVITTTRRLQEGWRALTVDGTGKWREWVVTEIDEEHTSGDHALGTYHFVWSLQYDLTLSYFHDTDYAVSIGVGNVCTAIEAAGHVLAGVHGWTVGTCDAADIVPGEPIYADPENKTKNSNKINTRGRVKGNPDSTGCVFIRESPWSKLSKLVGCTLYEVDSEIEVSPIYGVTARKLCLRAHLGNEEALRRFDWKEDLVSIKRTPDPGPYYCRVVPLGKTHEEYADDNETKYGWPLDITEETGTEQNPGPYWIQDDEAAQAFRIKAGDGVYVYPTVAVEYNDEDDPELLLNAAMADLYNHTRPGVIYEADVVQLAQAGMDVHGVALGDEVQVVDYGFNPDAGLRISGRIAKIEVDELSPETNTNLTIGYLKENMTDAVVSMGDSLDALEARNNSITEQMASMTTARYIDELLERINAEINATGGYSYLVPGEGLITYDVAVIDPITGATEGGGVAGQVVQIKGGSIRIANRKKSNYGTIDDWDFRSVFTADGLNADLITALHVVSGYIGDATNSNYWNLDTGEFVLRFPFDTVAGPSATSYQGTLVTKHGYVSTTSESDYVNLIGGGWSGSSIRYIPGFKVSKGSSENPYIFLVPYGSNYVSSGSYGKNAIVSSHVLNIWSCLEDSAGRSRITLLPHQVDIKISDHQVQRWPASSYDNEPQISISRSRILLRSYSSTASAQDDYGSPYYYKLTSTGHEFNGNITSKNSLTINGSLAVDGSIENSSFKTFHNGICSKYICAGSSTDTSGDNSLPADGTVLCRSLQAGTSGTTNGTITVNGSLYVRGGVLHCDGTVSRDIKSRLVDTENYGDRLLFCYETPAPMFGDLGSGALDDDGYAYVSIDDVFAETAHTDYNYQVFLQKCGPGDLWVAEKHPNYFVVQGTPNLAFDWEIKAHQVDVENMRLDSFKQYEAPTEGMRENSDMVNKAESKEAEDIPDTEKAAADIEDLYNDPIAELEQMYDEERAA